MSNKTDNIIYNIISNDSPQIIFNYFIGIVIFIFIFNKINFNINILIGLLFFSILVYYIYTYRNINEINNNEKYNEKFNLLYTDNNLLKRYSNITDILFYIRDLKIII